MSGRFDDDDDQDEVKKELVIPKYILLFEDMEVDIKHDMKPEEKCHAPHFCSSLPEIRLPPSAQQK